MAAGDLFAPGDIKQCRAPLSPAGREEAARGVARRARYGAKYFYTLREAASVLHCTYDEILSVIADYRLDVVLFLSAYRVPWYGLCEYLLDWDDDLEEALYEYLRSIARRNPGGSKTA
jgi:predicted DNA-binding ribbon-helix-helix protein